MKTDYVGYFWTVLKHKYWVYRYGRELGVGRWQLLMHDMSKFLPDEFIPYVHYFGRGKDEAFREAKDVAVRRHWERNPHHWAWYLQFGDEVLPMPGKYVREMVADWMAASKAYEGKGGIAATRQWWVEHRHGITLNPETESMVCDLLEIYF
jgi:hypothetical protein